MRLDQITPLILTYNEVPNINRTLQKLSWAKTIIVIDSYSHDNTLEILQSYQQIEVYQRKFDTHANQWNYGLEKIQSKWVLSLDADYTVTDELISEIETLPDDGQINGYEVRFRYCVFGKPLRGTILPPRQVLFEKDKALYLDDGHTQLLRLDGKSAMLRGYINHDDRKSLERWLWAQNRYMIIEAKKILHTPVNELSLSDRIRKNKIFAPFIVFVYCLLLKGGILDGWAGWYYALQRLLAEIVLSIRLIELEIFESKN